MSRVVITGMGVVAPIGVGLAAFEAGLRQARSGGATIRRFDAATFPRRAACEVDDAALAPHLDALDPADRAWLATDRKALLLAVAARMAVADAGPDATPPFARGLSFGPGIDYVDFDRSLSPTPDALGALPFQTVSRPAFMRVLDAASRPTRMPFDGPAGWAARRLGFRGPRAVNIGACAAGAMAIGEGLRMVRSGRVPVVLAAGFDSMISPLGVMGFSLLGALSGRHDRPAEASRPFDVTRDGFVPGEGAGALILEDLDHALARGARIYGELAGYGASVDAYKPTAPEPGGRGAAIALRNALADARMAPEEVGYVNAHGTGTPLNDQTETRALKAVLGAHAHRIPVSSTKSQIGHLVAGAGAVELVAGLLAMNGGFVPATINLHHPDPECDLDYVPNEPRAHRFDAFLSNSFGFGGQNGCLAVRRWKEPA